MIENKKTTTNPLLGAYPQLLLYGQLGHAPTKSRINITRSMTCIYGHHTWHCLLTEYPATTRPRCYPAPSASVVCIACSQPREPENSIRRLSTINIMVDLGTKTRMKGNIGKYT